MPFDYVGYAQSRAEGMEPRPFFPERGTRVRKVKGYPFPGIIVSTFNTLGGQQRYVVECTAPGVEGCLHIFSPEQLEPDDENAILPAVSPQQTTKSLALARKCAICDNPHDNDVLTDICTDCEARLSR
jgi:hypothetical protein